MRGILLINRRAVRARLQAVAAVLHVFVTAIFGRDGLGTVAAWAWPVDRTNDSLHAIIPLVLAVVGHDVVDAGVGTEKRARCRRMGVLTTRS